MTYLKREQAVQEMTAWAEYSTAPALAVISGDGTYRAIEADKEGVFVIQHDEEVMETMWTPHSAGITELTVMNAYSVSCCYNVSYVYEQTIRVPHGAEKLDSFLDQAITRAHENAEFFRSCDDDGPTYVDAISEGDGVCPYGDGLPVPEDYSEGGPRPVVVVQTAAGELSKVVVPRGEAHVVVVDEEGKETDRWSLQELQGQIGSAKRQAIKFGDAVDLLHDILSEINAYDEETEMTNDTDTGVVWAKFNSWRGLIRQTVGEPPKPLPF